MIIRDAQFGNTGREKGPEHPSYDVDESMQETADERVFLMADESVLCMMISLRDARTHACSTDCNMDSYEKL